MKLMDWLDHRTGARQLARAILEEPIPGGARWRYVWGSALLFVFVLQVITGVLLMTVYSPSATTAWGSVWYIQTQMTLGWLIRGLHHFGSQAMIVLLPVHLLQVLLARAYRAPRECTWWLGLALLATVFALALTGYLLPWDQKGYWATSVATNIMGLTPVIGRPLQEVIVGGGAYGHGTITRFYTLHVMVLPGLLTVLLGTHLLLFRRHGVTCSPSDSDKPAGRFWPDQLFRDTVACGVVLVTLLLVAGYTHHVLDNQLLDAPADPTASNYPARPEWYFLFLFQWLKYFEGPVREEVGTIVVPALLSALVLAIPFFDRIIRPRLAHLAAVALVGMIMLAAVGLTYAALRDDRDPPDSVVAAVLARQSRGEPMSDEDKAILRARTFNRKRERATRLARRAIELANLRGIPPEGPSALLDNDPTTRGPVLFAAHCAKCHRFNGHNGLGDVPSEPALSSDLAGFATRSWIRGLLRNPLEDRYFGLMVKPDGEQAHTRMSKWTARLREGVADEEGGRALRENFDAVAAYLEDESQSPGRLAGLTNEEVDALGDPLLARGRRFFMSKCNECHSYAGNRTGTTKAPEMLGYGSVDWIELMIANPGNEARYRSVGRERAQMPAFKERLSERDRHLIAEWIYSEY